MKKSGEPIKPKPAKATAQRTDWGEVADWYDQLVGDSGSEFHREVILPGTMRLLGLKEGDRAIDIACGQGVLCRLLARKGVRVTGIDGAAALIRAARERGDRGVDYQTGDARNLGFVPADAYDAAACVLAIQNMHPLAPIFRGVQRVLRPGGRLVIVMMHPCFRGPRESSWGWDDAHKIQYRRVDRYLLPRKSPIITHPGKSVDVYTWTFHKPIEAYVKSLRAAGLVIDAMEEWPSHKTSSSGPRAAAENVARKEIPMFLALRALKFSQIQPDDSDEAVEQAGGTGKPPAEAHSR